MTSTGISSSLPEEMAPSSKMVYIVDDDADVLDSLIAPAGPWQASSNVHFRKRISRL